METTEVPNDDQYPIQNLNCIHLYEHNKLPIEKFHFQAWAKDYLDCVLISNGFIKDRIEKLAEEIYRKYRIYDSLTCLVILNGSDLYFNDLLFSMRRLFSFDTDSKLKLNIEYVKVSSYSGTQSLNQITIKNLNEQTIFNNHVLIIEDIYDTGNSMDKLLKFLDNLSPLSLSASVLLHKRKLSNLKYNWNAEFIGFSIPDYFVVGYYLDYNNLFRDIPHLCIINQKGIEEFQIPNY